MQIEESVSYYRFGSNEAEHFYRRQSVYTFALQLTLSQSNTICSNVFLVIRRNEIPPTRNRRVISSIRHNCLSSLQRSILHYTTSHSRISRQRVGPTQYGEVCQADLIRVTVDDGGHAEVAGIYRVICRKLG